MESVFYPDQRWYVEILQCPYATGVGVFRFILDKAESMSVQIMVVLQIGLVTIRSKSWWCYKLDLLSSMGLLILEPGRIVLLWWIGCEWWITTSPLLLLVSRELSLLAHLWCLAYVGVLLLVPVVVLPISSIDLTVSSSASPPQCSTSPDPRPMPRVAFPGW